MYFETNGAKWGVMVPNGCNGAKWGAKFLGGKIFGKIFTENCIKIKKFDQGCIAGTPFPFSWYFFHDPDAYECHLMIRASDSGHFFMVRWVYELVQENM